MSAYGFIKCGTTQAMITFLACAVSGSLSLLAVGFGIASFRLVPSPRPKARVLEVVGVSMPLLVALLILASMLWG